MVRIGYAPGAFDLFHIGHLNLLREAKRHCDFLIAGVVSDEILAVHKGITPVVPLLERLEIVRNVRFVDAAHAAMTNDKLDIWRDLRFNILFKGDDWRATEKGERLERDFAAVGVDVVYFRYTSSTSSSKLRRTLQAIDAMANGAPPNAPDGDSGDPYPARVTRSRSRTRTPLLPDRKSGGLASCLSSL
jgi:glycerol-3-phosphate cytidylyltransferase